VAIFIFNKNSFDLYRIAENQNVMDQNKNFIDSDYDLVTINQEDFDNIRLCKKNINKVGNTFTLEDNSATFNKHAVMQENINTILSVIDSYLATNSHKPMASDIITYKNYVQTIDPSILITEENTSVTPIITGIPLNMSVEEYVENQGIKAINLLQLL
jgi:hypothetical protein